MIIATSIPTQNPRLSLVYPDRQTHW